MGQAKLRQTLFDAADTSSVRATTAAGSVLDLNAEAGSRQLFRACELSLHDLPESYVRGWETLGRNSIEANPFLSSQFVLAQARHLPNDAPQSIWTVVDRNNDPVLLIVAASVGASMQIPFTHLSDQTSVYKFQGGMLLDPRVSRAALATWLQFLKTTRFRHGIVFSSMCIDTSLSAHLYTSAALTGFQVQLHGNWSRASLNLLDIDRTRLLESCLSGSRRKSLRRSFAKLQSRGQVSFRVIDQLHEIPGAVERFLDLEQRGWKRDSGTAIGCSPSHQAFFEAFVTGMAEAGQILFGELLIGDKVVASTCNLISGQTLFAFKIGWDPDLRDGSPGTWTEIELANYVARERPEITLLNGCSTAGSYLDRLWPHRLPMGNVILSQSNRAVIYSGIRKTLRTARRLLWTGETQSSVETPMS